MPGTAKPVAGAPGDWVPTETIKLVNRTGAAISKGDVVAIDFVATATESSAYATWLADSTPTPGENPLATAIKPATAHLEGWVFAVALEAVADNAWGQFGIRGIFEVNTGVSSAVTGIGDKITAVNAAHTTVTTSDGNCVLGIALEAGATGTTADTTWVLFDGWALSAAGVAGDYA